MKYLLLALAITAVAAEFDGTGTVPDTAHAAVPLDGAALLDSFLDTNLDEAGESGSTGTREATVRLTSSDGNALLDALRIAKREAKKLKEDLENANGKLAEATKRHEADTNELNKNHEAATKELKEAHEATVKNFNNLLKSEKKAFKHQQAELDKASGDLVSCKEKREAETKELSENHEAATKELNEAHQVAVETFNDNLQSEKEAFERQQAELVKATGDFDKCNSHSPTFTEIHGGRAGRCDYTKAMDDKGEVDCVDWGNHWNSRNVVLRKVYSAAACQALCLANPRCKFATYGIHANDCYLSARCDKWTASHHHSKTYVYGNAPSNGLRGINPICTLSWKQTAQAKTTCKGSHENMGRKSLDDCRQACLDSSTCFGMAVIDKNEIAAGHQAGHCYLCQSAETKPHVGAHRTPGYMTYYPKKTGP
jgi:hypothetical protein